MATALEGERTAGLPVLRRQRIGEQFIGGLVDLDWRDELDDEGNPKPKYRDGQPVMRNGVHQTQKEVVIYLLVYKTDMEVGLAGERHVPERGELVRHILSGGGAAQWISALDAYKQGAGPGAVAETGLLVAVNSTYAETYRKGAGKPEKTGRIDSQEQLDQFRLAGSTETVGLRGDLGVRKADPGNPDEVAFAQACEAAYQASFADKATPLESNGAAQPAPAAQASPDMAGFFSAGPQ